MVCSYHHSVLLNFTIYLKKTQNFSQNENIPKPHLAIPPSNSRVDRDAPSSPCSQLLFWTWNRIPEIGRCHQHTGILLSPPKVNLQQGLHYTQKEIIYLSIPQGGSFQREGATKEILGKSSVSRCPFPHSSHHPFPLQVLKKPATCKYLRASSSLPCNWALLEPFHRWAGAETREEQQHCDLSLISGTHMVMERTQSCPLISTYVPWGIYIHTQAHKGIHNPAHTNTNTHITSKIINSGIQEKD